MKTTLIVGAGATLAEALPSHPKKSLHPPLDGTFFAHCSASGYRQQRPIRTYMEAGFGIDPFSEDRGMEEVFNFIYTDAHTGNPSARCLDAYWALISLYRFALAATTNPLQGNSRAGVGAVIRALFEHDPSREFTVITFNQDLVIEKALERTAGMAKYSALPWSIRHAYGINFSSFNTMVSNSVPFSQSAPSSIQVLKLHGSLNWVYPVRSGSDPKNALRHTQRNPICVNDQSIYNQLTRTVRRSSRRRTQDLIPILVPPVYEKSTQVAGLLSSVWDNARAALLQTEELVIFGYSFPDADFAAKAMLRHSLHQNDSLSTVHIIDINPAVAGKVADISGTSSFHFYRDVATFKSVFPDEH